jgi:hypothetical protein
VHRSGNFGRKCSSDLLVVQPSCGECLTAAGKHHRGPEGELVVVQMVGGIAHKVGLGDFRSVCVREVAALAGSLQRPSSSDHPPATTHHNTDDQKNAPIIHTVQMSNKSARMQGEFPFDSRQGAKKSRDGVYTRACV